MRLFVSIVGVLAAATSYATVDIAPYAILNPPDSSYVQADSAIIPKLGITNLGDEAVDNFWVKLLAVDETGDATIVDSAGVGHIGAYPDSIEVELSAWTPDCICRKLDDGGPFLEYTLSGIASFEADENPENDTVRQSVTSLWPHDAGVTELILDPPPEEPNNHYDLGDTIFSTGIIENFGFHTERNVAVRFFPGDSGIGWDPIYNIELLEWRGNPSGNPFTAQVEFVPYVIMEEKARIMRSRTEMAGDMCQDDDEASVPVDISIEEEKSNSAFALVVASPGLSGQWLISYSTPFLSNVSIRIYDACGKKVETVIEGVTEAGAYTVAWECPEFPPGVYMIRMEANNFRATRKVIIR